MKYLKTYNESLKDVLKGKSDDEIFKDLNISEINPNYLLELSIFNNHIAGVKKAVELGANLFSKNYNAFQSAYDYCRFDILNFLLHQDDKINKKLKPINYLIYSTASNYLEGVKKALKLNITISNSNKYYYSFMNAISHNYYDMVKYFLDNKLVNPAEESQHSFKIACSKGYIDILKLLLTNENIDPSNYDNIGIYIAKDYNQPEVVKLLLDDERVKNSLIQADYDMFYNFAYLNN